MPPMPVEIVTLTAKPVEQTSEFVASLKSRDSTTIQPEVEGFITRIAVRSGQRVVAGAVLFEIDSAPEQAALGSLQSMRPMREAEVEFARQQVERNKTLLDAGAISQREVEQFETAAARRRGAVEGARRTDPPAAQPAELLPRHRAERRHGRRHPGQRRRSRHPIDGADDRGRERRARGLHQRARAAGAAIEGRPAGPPRWTIAASCSPPTGSPSCRPTSTPRRSRCWPRRSWSMAAASSASDQFVRARVVWYVGARPDRAGHRGASHQRAVLRVRRGESGRRAWSRNRSRCSWATSSATTTSCKSGLAARRTVDRLGAAEDSRWCAGDAGPAGRSRAPQARKRTAEHDRTT